VTRPARGALAAAALALGAAVALGAAPARAQSSCSDDGLGRHHRFVGRVDYGASSYLTPTPATFVNWDLALVLGGWFVASDRCQPWHLRVQPELSLQLTIHGNTTVDPRGRLMLALGPASSLAQFSYVPGAYFGLARGVTGAGFVHALRLEVLFGAAGLELFHAVAPGPAPVHQAGFHALLDVYAVVQVFAGFGRLASR
jgi:hypothetical protein